MFIIILLRLLTIMFAVSALVMFVLPANVLLLAGSAAATLLAFLLHEWANDLARMRRLEIARDRIKPMPRPKPVNTWY